VDCGACSNFSSNAVGTIAIWFKNTVLGSGVDTALMSYTDTASTVEWFQLQRNSSNTIKLRIADASGVVLTAETAATTSQDNWHLFVVRMDTTGSTFWLDNTKDASVTYTGCTSATQAWFNTVPQTQSPHLRIGAMKYAGSIYAFWGGLIDYTTIYSTALSDSAVSALWTAGEPSTGVFPVPDLWWHPRYN
jgi:hypothetical protein